MYEVVANLVRNNMTNRDNISNALPDSAPKIIANERQYAHDSSNRIILDRALS